MRHFIFLLLFSLLMTCQSSTPQQIQVLIFSKTEGFRHNSIEKGVQALADLAKANNWTSTATENANVFTDQQLQNYDAIIFLNTTGDILGTEQEIALERYIQAGGGFVGIHAASDTEYNWPWYGALVGAQFESHPTIQDAEIEVIDATHAATQHLPNPWPRKDEWYNFKENPTEVNILLNLKESTYEGGKMGAEHPFAWYHEHDGGRSFYVAGGHTEESYEEEAFLQLIKEGIRYAAGTGKRDYSKAHSEYPPLQNRFVKQTLLDHLDEPMELAILPDGRVLFVERKGRIRSYNPKNEHIATVAMIDVHSGEEDGLLGIAIDPAFAENHWIYLYYSPKGGHDRNLLARYEFKNGAIDLASKVEILEVPTNRPTCCHSGGSLAFGPDGLLYLSTGDNSNPFESAGFAPIDERPGRAFFDAQRSAANTNDLRGKILRIRPEADGRYSIPEGNLFPQGTANTRPEIYVMGCRNPFRIDIDQERNWLFWGDVGPDSGETRENRGPKGIDEINVAKSPGFYGWPYFRGPLTPYRDFNFANNVSGPHFDATNAINDSPNNTGLKQLPAPRGAMIWYSYDASEEFPWVEIGGKNPMAGPVYYSKNYEGKNKFPEWYDGKLLIYEWMRHWIYSIEMDSAGGFQRAVRFMPEEEFSRPMDMAFAPDGTLYMLEYGDAWFAKNPEAQLSRIQYVRGNRPPQAEIVASDYQGKAPLSVTFDASQSKDPDGDNLSYEWKVNGTIASTDKKFSTELTLPGIYEIQLMVKDEQGLSGVSQSSVQVGNAVPQIDIRIAGNQSFYWENQIIRYEVDVQDEEDGVLYFGINPKRVQFNIQPVFGADLMKVQMGHQTADNLSGLARGEQLINGSDCKNCHGVNTKINGPSYMEVAQFYEDTPASRELLSSKIIKGGGGNWGQKAMAAHPQLTKAEALAMVDYILSLDDDAETIQQMALDGVYMVAPSEEREKPQYALSARFTDAGNGRIDPITKTEQRILLYPRLESSLAIKPEKAEIKWMNRGSFTHLKAEDKLRWEAVDMSQIDQVFLRVKNEERVTCQLKWGDKVLTSQIIEPSEEVKRIPVTIPVETVSDKKPLVFEVKEGTVWLHTLEFERTSSTFLSMNQQ